MGNRLSKIYTRTGDDGTTGMADGSRISKADLRFDAMGKIDLLNSQIGFYCGAILLKYLVIVIPNLMLS